MNTQPEAYRYNPTTYAGMTLQDYFAAKAKMTLRDYFAAKAMQSFMSDPEIMWTEKTMIAAAKNAYETADAMMKAREE